MGMWTSNTKESHGLRGSCLAQLWEDHWRIRDKSSAVTVCPVPHFCSCSGAEALGSCSSCAEWESCSSALAQISPCRPRVGSMDRRGPGAVCRLTLQCVPKLESLSGYSSRNHQSHTQLERPLRKDGTTLEPQVLPKPAASLQTLAPLLHITTVRKCNPDLILCIWAFLTPGHWQAQAILVHRQLSSWSCVLKVSCKSELDALNPWDEAFSFSILIKAFATANV